MNYDPGKMDIIWDLHCQQIWIYGHLASCSHFHLSRELGLKGVSSHKDLLLWNSVKKSWFPRVPGQKALNSVRNSNSHLQELPHRKVLLVHVITSFWCNLQASSFANLRPRSCLNWSSMRNNCSERNEVSLAGYPKKTKGPINKAVYAMWVARRAFIYLFISSYTYKEGPTVTAARVNVPQEVNRWLRATYLLEWEGECLWAWKIKGLETNFVWLSNLFQT